MFLEPLELSSSGRAILYDGEVERLIVDNVTLKFYKRPGGIETAPADIYESGNLTLTSHRILWIDDKMEIRPGRSCFIPLSAVSRWEVNTSVATRLKIKTDKISLFVTSDFYKKPNESRFVVANIPARKKSGVDGLQMEHVALKFVNGIPANFQEQLSHSSRDKRWESTSSQSSPHENIPEGINPTHLQALLDMGFSRDTATQASRVKGNGSLTDAIEWAIIFQKQLGHHPSPDLEEEPRKAIKSGLGDIFKREQERNEERDQALGDAFQDLDSLMQMAEEMVKLSNEFYNSFAKNSSGEQQSELEKDTIEELVSMGIPSPVTKDSAGSLYLDQLCRQLVDFIADPLDKSGGIMTLATVYCHFNRARGGAELVSPDDLLSATKLFGKLKLPIRIRTLDSGVRVIQSVAHDEDAVCRRIAEMVQCETGLSRPLFAATVMSELNVPLTIAQEHLHLAERSGVLCRDDGPEGLRFYNNFFNNVSP